MLFYYHLARVLRGSHRNFTVLFWKQHYQFPGILSPLVATWRNSLPPTSPGWRGPGATLRMRDLESVSGHYISFS